MPINIPQNLPAYAELTRENIFVMSEDTASKQDIRPVKALIVNLMPMKIETEAQLLRLLSNSPLQVDITLLHAQSHLSKNTPPEHLEEFYKTFNDVRESFFDAMIITGAPVEHLPFEEVSYWHEITEIMEWSKTHVYSTMYICWGALAGLYYHFGIDKVLLSRKLSGVYRTVATSQSHPLTRGFDEFFYVPHSRIAGVDSRAVQLAGDLEVLAFGYESGTHLIADKTNRHIFVTGHPEYDKYTLKNEYTRDIDRGLEPTLPCNYFFRDDENAEPIFSWRGHAGLMFSNWLNYCVYQNTPYDLRKLLTL